MSVFLETTYCCISNKTILIVSFSMFFVLSLNKVTDEVYKTSTFIYFAMKLTGTS